MRLNHAVMLLAAGGLLGALLWTHAPPCEAEPPPLLIVELREIAELAVLCVPVSAIHVESIDGYLGGVRCVLILHGTVTIGCDLSSPALMQQAPGIYLLQLTEPRMLSATIDLEHTRIHAVERDGLWRLLPGSAGEHEVVALALARAQGHVADAVHVPDHVQATRHRIEQLMTQMTYRTGVTVHIEWQ
jgi:hypothetical protein